MWKRKHQEEVACCMHKLICALNAGTDASGSTNVINELSNQCNLCSLHQPPNSTRISECLDFTNTYHDIPCHLIQQPSCSTCLLYQSSNQSNGKQSFYFCKREKIYCLNTQPYLQFHKSYNHRWYTKLWCHPIQSILWYKQHEWSSHVHKQESTEKKVVPTMLSKRTSTSKVTQSWDVALWSLTLILCQQLLSVQVNKFLTYFHNIFTYL